MMRAEKLFATSYVNSAGMPREITVFLPLWSGVCYASQAAPSRDCWAPSVPRHPEILSCLVGIRLGYADTCF